jgi:putative aldouronate transport system substrate-binding protein
MKKLLIFLLIVAVALTLCAGVAAESAKFDPPITITAVRIAPNPATTSYLEGDSPENNVWTRRYLEEWGINLEYKWMVADEQWTEKVNLMIASTELPDIFQVTPTQFQQLYEADLLVDQTEAFEKYASEYTKKVMFESGDGPYNSALRDGKLMALPWTGMPKEGFPFISVRADWEKELGLTGINTFDDLVSYMRAFKGMADDNIGYSSASTLTGIYRLFNCFGSYPDMWIEQEDGKLVYGAIQPETKEALAAVQKLYAEGLLDPEFGTRDSAKTVELLASGKLGIFPIAFSGPLYPWQNVKNNFPEAEISFYPIPTIAGGAAKAGHGLGVSHYWVVTKDCEYPEAATMMLNTWMEIFYANTDDEVFREYVNWDDGNEVWKNAFVQGYRGFKNLDGYYNNVAVLRGEKSLDELTPEERGVNEKIVKALAGDNSLWCWNRIYGENGSLAIVDYYKTNDLYLQNGFTGTPTASMVDYQAIIDKLQLETFTKIIQGADITEFDAFVTQWLALGGAAITDEVNEWKANQ